MYITSIDLDLSGERNPLTVYAKQGDVSSRLLDIGFIDNGSVYSIPEGTAARIWIKKPDGKKVFNEAEISDNRVNVILTNQALAASGLALAEIELYQGDTRISSSVFRIQIEEKARDEAGVESSNEYSALERMVNDAEALKIEMAQAVKAAQDARDSAQNILNEISGYLSRTIITIGEE